MVDSPAEPDAGTTLAAFESLGDTCEFGFVQRHFGLEPISLLRWNGAPLAGLVAGLRARFADLYRYADLVVIDGGSVLDTKYDLRFHAGQYTRDGGSGRRSMPRTEQARLTHAREAQHIAFLRRLTLDSLESRSKVFVYKTNEGLSLLEILQLKTALDLYGSQRLFCVLPAGEQIAAGAVRAIATGVKVGGIARFAPYERQEDIDPQAWLALCRAALQTPWGDEIVAPVQIDAAAQPAHSPPLHTIPMTLFEPTPRGVAIHDEHLARAVLTAMYETLLLRPPDPDGLQAHSRHLASGQCGLETLIEAMLESPEFASKSDSFMQRYVRHAVTHAPPGPVVGA